MNEREDTSRLSRRPTSREGSRRVGGESFTPPVVSATTASDTTREVILPPGLQLPPPAKVDVVAASKETSAAATSEEAGKGGNDEDATRKTPTEEEIRLIESECVQVMHGVIALQGGVLSRDLWGLHAVSGGRGMSASCSEPALLGSWSRLRSATIVGGCNECVGGSTLCAIIPSEAIHFVLQKREFNREKVTVGFSHGCKCISSIGLDTVIGFVLGELVSFLVERIWFRSWLKESAAFCFPPPGLA